MRQEPQNRRPCYKETIRDSNGTPYSLTVSYQDEKIKEVWINGGGKSGTERFDILTEIGRILSVALQNGTPMKDLMSCATYHTDGRPSTIVGIMFKKLNDLI
tara:strand:+ start:1062 stop:1367 length:306 start_codon:yes stop_codon:yes gene_type:complete